MRKSYIKSVIILIIALVTLSGGAIYGQADDCWSPFSIEADRPNICKGEGTKLNLSNPYSAPITSIQWYKYTPPPETPEPPCDEDCPIPPQFPAPGWVPVQSGGTVFQTNQLFQSTCFAAIVNTGCCECRNVVKVCVCEPLSTASIDTTPSTEFSDLQEDIQGYNDFRACNNWEGTITLNYDFDSCPTTVAWTRTITESDGTSTTENLYPTTPTKIDTGSLTADDMCWRKYHYVAALSNECENRNVSIDIYIDGNAESTDLILKGTEWIPNWDPPNQGSPLGEPDGICNVGQSAVIRATPDPCVKEDNEGGIQIESWFEQKPGVQWDELTEAGQTWTYFTNKLENTGVTPVTYKYRVKFRNGACEGWSSVYEILVKPTLTVTIPSNETCPPPPAIITAYPSYLPDNGTCTWYHNGEQLNETGNPISVFEPGYYYVEVDDPTCDVKATSNIIRICSNPIVVIAGPCGICEGETITLEALVAATPSGCADNCTFSWTGPYNFTATSSIITVTSPGTYTVTAACGPCDSEPVSINVEECPEIQPCECGQWDPDNLPQVNYTNDTSTQVMNCEGNVVYNIPVNTTIHNITGKYICNPEICQATYHWSVNGPSLELYGNDLPIPSFPLSSPGEYIVIIHPKCGVTECQDCVIRLKFSD